MTFNRPQLAIVSTPIEGNDAGAKSVSSPVFNSWSTPSPQSVGDFESNVSVTSSNRSAVVSRMLSDHLSTARKNWSPVETGSWTPSDNHDEFVASSSRMTLPELEEARHANAAFQRMRTPTNSPPTSTPKHIPPMPVQHKMLYQSVSSIASPIREEDFMPQLRVESPERTVVFHAESIGIKISRHTDGYVRVLHVAPGRSDVAAAGGADAKVREGVIRKGDVVREVGDVNLRMPIDSAVWKLTVGLIKMAPRPLRFVVARELHVSSKAEEDADAGAVADMKTGGPPLGQSSMDNQRFGPTREVHFFESALGIKLNRTAAGYVQIISVTPYKSFPNSPQSRTGEMKEGDFVLEVGGVWNLREPIDRKSWAALIEYIKYTRRPLCMVVADGGYEPTTFSEEMEECQDRHHSPYASGANSDSDNNARDKWHRRSTGEEAPEDSERIDSIPDLREALNEQSSTDALQKELEATSS